MSYMKSQTIRELAAKWLSDLNTPQSELRDRADPSRVENKEETYGAGFADGRLEGETSADKTARHKCANELLTLVDLLEQAHD